MKVASYNGCKVYNLSSGKTAPQWLSQSKRRQLAKDEEYRRRLELIQDFEMPTASQCITMTRDGEHIIVTGIYPPIVKCYTTSDLAMKFQRGLTCDVVAVETLSDDFGKLAFLQSDRTLSLHAPYGVHYNVRVPKFGRHMVYDYDSCDLLVGGNGNEIYRLNLETGQFREPFELGFEGCNKLHINPLHGLLGCAGEGGICEFWDPRQRDRVARLTLPNPTGESSFDATEIKFDIDGLTLGVGTSNGFVHLYDIRSGRPQHTKEHQYGLPIVDITFHQPSRSIISTDKKVIKIWSRQEPEVGKVMTNIEAPAEINSLVVARDSRGPSGLIMVAGEQSRVMTYFVPQLGPAPRWCSFLEGLTEELEESAQQSVYEDYKFLTRQEVDDLGAGGLIGTPMLKAYMHGFFIDMKLYNKLRAVSKPFEYEEYRKAKIREKIEAKRESRIATMKKLPKVNKDLAEKMMKKNGAGEEEGGKQLVDDRFKALFEREEFQQDTEAPEFRLHHPNAAKKAALKANNYDSDDELDIYDEVEEEEDEADSDPSLSDNESETDDDEEYEKHLKHAKRHRSPHVSEEQEDIGAIQRASMRRKERNEANNRSNNSKNKKKMFQLAEGFSVADAVFGDSKVLKETRRNTAALAAVPLKDRLQQKSQEAVSTKQYGNKKFGNKKFDNRQGGGFKSGGKAAKASKSQGGYKTGGKFKGRSRK